jgi:hypothetical protein
MPSRSRSPLTPVSVITAAAVLFVFGALSSAQIFNFGESARRSRCANNLKQLAISVHNYHDTMSSLPPLATDEGHWTWTALLLPYLEEDAVYRKINFAEAAKAEGNKALVTEFKMPTLLCPSRRAKAARKEGDFKGGQPSDYVAISTTDLKKFGNTTGAIVYRLTPPNKDVGIAALKSRTKIASVVDGTSNTAMIAEKHMLKDWLDGKYDEPALVALNDQNTIRIASTVEKDEEDGKEVEKLRGLAADAKDTDDWKFGSAHPDVCQFGMVDGSVRTVMNKTDPKILRMLCDRRDGMVFKLP